MSVKIPDFEPPEGPPDVRLAALAVRNLLRHLGMPPRGPDGEHQVLLACALPPSLHLEVFSWTSALANFEPDRVVLGMLHRAHDDAATTPLAVVLLVLGEGGHYWCAPIGLTTHAKGAAPEA